jgi:endonuclease-3
MIQKKAIKLIHMIAELVKPLNPPVFAFENTICDTPFKILISVLLSARTKDDVTRMAVTRLFSAADSPQQFLALGEDKIRELIYPVGFYATKAKHIIELCEILKNQTEIPSSVEELMRLPGVGRKTANLVRALAFHIPSIAVDIHVFRISKRLGMAIASTPDLVELELEALFPDHLWNTINQTLVGFGQTICKPRYPLCSKCSITEHCLYFKSNKQQYSQPTK